MKVIARVDAGKYLVEATLQELASLADRKIHTDEHDPEGSYQSSRRDCIKIGTEFKISNAWAQIHRNDKRKAEVQTVRKQLEAVITQLDMIEPFLDEPKPEEAAPLPEVGHATS